MPKERSLAPSSRQTRAWCVAFPFPATRSPLTVPKRRSRPLCPSLALLVGGADHRGDHKHRRDRRALQHHAAAREHRRPPRSPLQPGRETPPPFLAKTPPSPATFRVSNSSRPGNRVQEFIDKDGDGSDQPMTAISSFEVNTAASMHHRPPLLWRTGAFAFALPCFPTRTPAAVASLCCRNPSRPHETLVL